MLFGFGDEERGADLATAGEVLEDAVFGEVQAVAVAFVKFEVDGAENGFLGKAQRRVGAGVWLSRHVVM